MPKRSLSTSERSYPAVFSGGDGEMQILSMDIYPSGGNEFKLTLILSRFIFIVRKDANWINQY